MNEEFFSQSAIVGNVWVKLMKFEQGQTMDGHAHVFDHVTLLTTGKVLMEHDLGSQEFIAPALIVTKKGIIHKFTALENNTTLSCVHAIREGELEDNIAAPEITLTQAQQLLQEFPLVEPTQGE